ncbi:transcription factor TFIIIB subunit brf1 [Friedmanniomyces endolithicus]|nr:transcription factor TFIIIB subunit brf1 [Friedmanniomyces endolithicus]KAK0802537.1 transcription factor TFIIIB subunit brf1 [Friedmanniomyces endolithicus]KAK0812859.1 transcription factor TFIIIB subunit brf1 [Friedmanniomyces endolithicus]KAK0818880.1 transcription factor TFIIIB subunit brf1 [Friedmanniomyces endolithicus]KAK0867267.1 transcription factor TFIIIB subunit brf1 [Friedmanniomyces endolithicus]
MAPVPSTAPRRQRLDTLNPPAPELTRPKPKAAAPAKPTCCDEPDIQNDDGSRVCVNCGTQLSEANIVADVTFEEDARGAATVQGGFIGEHARHARTLGNGVYRKIGGGERSASQTIEATGRRALNALCPPLGVPQRTSDQAQQLFNLAAEVSFTTGRRTDEVVGACLFVACRRQKDNTVLLMDIAEVQKINVFRLGEVYKALCDKLYCHDSMNVGIQHIVDIEPLIQRYCRKLEFGPKTRDVATDAVRILKRMKRDWIVTGRHPAGLCGACIILAARMNNFRRTVREVVYVAKIADQTIALRVEEFRRTRAADLSVDQFRQYGTRLKGEHDPPVLTTSSLKKQKFEAMKRQRKEQGVARATAERETVERETAEQESRDRDAAGDEPIVLSDGEDSDSSEDSSPSATPGGRDAEDEPRRKKQRTAGPESTPAATQQEPRFDADGFAIPALPVVDPALGGEAAEDTTPPKRKRGRPRKIDRPRIEITPEELSVEEDLAHEIDENLHNEMLEKMRDEAWQAKQDEEAAAALERIQPAADQAREQAIQNEQQRREAEGVDWRPVPEINTAEPTAEELEAEFENDPEVANCLLSETEAMCKERIWIHHNEDWLRAQHEKELLKKIAELTNGGKVPGKRSGKTGKKRTKLGDRSVLENAETPIETPADAASAMLKKRAPAAFSKYVNYEMLERVYNHRRDGSGSGSGTGTPATETSRSRAGSVASVSPEGGEGGSGAAGRRVSFNLPAARGAKSATANAATRVVPDAPMSPPATQSQVPAAQQEDEGDGDGNGDEDTYADNDNDNEDDYQSETSGVARDAGWDDVDDDWQQGNNNDDDDADYRRVVGGDDGGTYGGDEEERAGEDQGGEY